MDLEFFENRTQINASIRCKEGVDGIIRYRITNGTQASPTIDKHSISLKFKIIKDTGWNTWESVDFLGGVAQNVENKETINGSFICVPAPNPTTTSTASTTTAVLPVTTSKASSTTSPIVSSTTQRGPDSTSAGSSNGSDDSSSTNKEGNNQTIIIVCAVVGGMILITLVVVLIYYLRRRRQKALTSKPPQPMADQYCTSEGEDENNYNVLHERVRPVKDDIYNEIYELSTDPRLDPRLVNDKSYKSEGTKPTENGTYNVLRERVRPPQGNYNTINYSIMPGSTGEEMDGSIYDECLDNTDQTYNVLRERVGPTPENYSTVSDSKPDDNPESYTYSEVDRDYLRERRQAQPRVDMVDNDLYEGCSDEYANV